MKTLIADIGGTNTRVALAEDGVLTDATIKRFRNADHDGLDSVLAAYFDAQGKVALDGACVDIAGPVANGVGTLTNLDWTLREDLIGSWTGAGTVALINDLQAQGHGAADLPQAALRCIVEGSQIGAAQSDTRLIVNVGTGFNAAVVLDNNGTRVVPPSESGHANLPIRTQKDLDLCLFLENIHGFPAVEDVLSGRGLERVYYWLGLQQEDPAQCSAAEIIARYRTEKDPRAETALRMFIRIFGTVSGNLALIHLPFGGVYLVGGVACALGPLLNEFGFCDAFRDKGRFAGLMANFPIHVVEDDYAALRGAARHLHFLLDARKN